MSFTLREAAITAAVSAPPMLATFDYAAKGPIPLSIEAVGFSYVPAAILAVTLAVLALAGRAKQNRPALGIERQE